MISLKCRSTNPSAIMVAQALSRLGYEAEVGPRPATGAHVVCWGVAHTHGLNRGGTSVTNKLFELYHLSRWVPTPKASSGPRPGYLGRTLHHSKGTDFPNQDRLYPFYVKVHPIKEEYRVHAFRGRVLAVQQKVRADDGRTVVEWPRTHRNGWIFQDLRDYHTRLEELGLQSLWGLGLDFGAVDIIHCADDDKYRVLEVNRAPGLTQTRAKLYARAIDEWARESS